MEEICEADQILLSRPFLFVGCARTRTLTGMPPSGAPPTKSAFDCFEDAYHFMIELESELIRWKITLLIGLNLRVIIHPETIEEFTLFIFDRSTLIRTYITSDYVLAVSRALFKSRNLCYYYITIVLPKSGQ